MNKEDVKEKLITLLKAEQEEKNKLFKKLLNELDGKVMNYSTCSMLDEFWQDYNNKIIENFSKSFVDAIEIIAKNPEDKSFEEDNLMKGFFG